MKFKQTHFQPFTIEIENKEEAVLLYIALSATSPINIQEAIINSYYEGIQEVIKEMIPKYKTTEPIRSILEDLRKMIGI